MNGRMGNCCRMIPGREFPRVSVVLFSVVLACSFVSGARAAGGGATELPVIDPATRGFKPVNRGIRNLYSREMLRACLRDGDTTGLLLDLSARPCLLDSSVVDPQKIHGRAFVGRVSSPDEGKAGEGFYEKVEFSSGVPIEQGKAVLPAPAGGTGTLPAPLVLRFELSLESPGKPRDLGAYELPIEVRREGGRLVREPGLAEGPFVANLRSDDPSTAVIAFTTEVPLACSVELRKVGESGSRRFEDAPSTGHEIVLSGLGPGTDYEYRVGIKGRNTRFYHFRSAPPPGGGSVRFAFIGDCREGPGEEARRLMGVNGVVFGKELSAAWQANASFVIIGGDLANGYTTSLTDFEEQLGTFKWVAAPFLHERPLYPLMGNHDSLLRTFETSDGRFHRMDRWPYSTESSEAVFARAFVLPENGPEPDDPRRPPYRETVYSFVYGPVAVVELNNKYWLADEPELCGGAPDGFLLEDQMRWLESELSRLERNPGVRYILVCGHLPPFPNGGHVGAAMWGGGNNRLRSYERIGASRDVRAAGSGMVEVRNRIAALLGRSAKVAAFIGSDEHNYSRTLLTRSVPAGVPGRDSTDAKGRICAGAGGCSPLTELERPTWYLTSGGGGAPTYAADEAPWNRFWRDHPQDCAASCGCFRFRECRHWLLFEAGPERIGVTVYDVDGQEVDSCPDLMAVRRP